MSRSMEHKPVIVIARMIMKLKNLKEKNLKKCKEI
jgi:hypothetical protein